MGMNGTVSSGYSAHMQSQQGCHGEGRMGSSKHVVSGLHVPSRTLSGERGSSSTAQVTRKGGRKGCVLR
jgi:hypothetical protein